MADYTTNPATDISDSDIAKMCSEILQWHKEGIKGKRCFLRKGSN